MLIVTITMIRVPLLMATTAANKRRGEKVMLILRMEGRGSLTVNNEH